MQQATCRVQWADGHYHAGCVQGWAVSVLFHGLMIALAVALLSDLKLVPQAEPFKWDVAMVEPSRPAPPTEEPTHPARPVPQEPRPVEKRMVQTQQVIQRVQPVQEVVQQKVREVRPIVQAVPLTSETVAIPQTPTARESIAPVEPAPSVETPQREAVTQREVVSEQPAIRETPALQQEARVQQLPVQSRPMARPDFSWLAEALWSRVERLKRYPHLARLNRWEGKVVLQAVVREDGQVLDVKVSQSSGYAILDQDGMEVLRRASPLSLKHPLGQAQVVIQVPISYRLEH